MSSTPGSQLNQAIRKVKETLAANPHLEARGTIDTEAEQIVMAVASLKSRSELFFADDLPAESLRRALEIAAARSKGIPLQHLTGVQQFLGHEYEVGPGVLVPRPETEVLVSSMIDAFSRRERLPTMGLEVGIGSGVISIELLSRFPGLNMLSSELTEAAREIAVRNAEKILVDGCKRLDLLEAARPLEVWEPFDRDGALERESADFLVSNPPYLMSSDSIDQEVRDHEPWTALFAPEEDPLIFYRLIADGTRSRLRPDGEIWLEVPHERSRSIADLISGYGWVVTLIPDLTGRERVLRGVRAQGALHG